MHKTLLSLLVFSAAATSAMAQSLRETQLFDRDWRFAYGNASAPIKDFGCGTEYFNYLTKAASIHNEGPYAAKFDDSAWEPVRLPHDWATTLPYAREASHSHGYHTVGWRYPETSVGWYRKTFAMDTADADRHTTLTFEGIFRNSVIWVNGFYVGGEQRGYASRTYDITDYLHYGPEDENLNVIAVRANASLEEGWFYEGAGIYRNVWMTKTAPVHVAHDGTYVRTMPMAGSEDLSTRAILLVDATIENSQSATTQCVVTHTLLDVEGHEVAHSKASTLSLKPRDSRTCSLELMVERPTLWDLDNPYLYTLRTDVAVDGNVVDSYTTTTGIHGLQRTHLQRPRTDHHPE